MQLSRLVLLSASYILGLLLFQRGFLLKRQILSNKSSCDDVLTDQNCWNQPVYNKTIWLIIDALRHDFIDPVDSMTTVLLKERFYRGHMPKTGNILKKQPENARLYKFLADPPTTTLQRLKALTTGTLPTFIEAGDNFGGTEILEDNLVDQLKNSGGKKLTFLGDDTWMSILPKKFDREFPAPSFDIKDLHTVDDLVESRIYEEVKRADWDVLIAHCLGVDHCGHRYGPDHPEMAKKLQQMDELISKLIQELPEDAILIVNGDHGMTETGDHGGDSEQEVSAAMFVYSKKGLPRSDFEETVNQIDLIPTLSVLMDIPIPFSNLGSVIKSLIPEHLVSEALKLNCMQIIRFAQACMQHEPSLGLHLDGVLRTYEASTENDPVDAQKTIERVQRVLRAIWTSFDLTLTNVGLLVLTEAVFFNVVQLFSDMGDYEENFGQITLTTWVFRSGMILLKLALFIGKSDEVIIMLLTGSTLLSMGYHLVVLVMQILAQKIAKWVWIPIAVGIIYPLTFLSNSFIVYEPSVIRFMLQSLLAVYLCNFLKRIWTMRRSFLGKGLNSDNQLWSAGQIILVLAAVRAGKVFEKCREEQVGCVATVFSTTLSSLSMDWMKTTRLLLGIASLFALNMFMMNFNRGRAHLNGFLRITRALSWPVCVLISLHWLCEFVSSNFDQFGLRLAQVVYAVFVVVFIGSGLALNRQEAIEASFHMFVLTMGMVLGDGLVPNLLLVMLANDFGFQIIGKDALFGGLFLSLMTSHAFFSLGHTSTLAQIPWQAAFVGIPGNFAIQAVPGLLVILHIFAGIFVLVWRNVSTGQMTDSQALSLMLFGGFKAIAVCLAGFIHRRHLMLFKVFAPKFIFEGIGFILLCLVLISFQILKLVKSGP